jgi:Homeodomain-like domain
VTVEAVGGVDWSLFLFYAGSSDAKFSPAWLMTPANVTSSFRGGSSYCRLCDSAFAGPPVAHVESHRLELEAFLTGRRDGGLGRRAERRERVSRARRLHADGKTVREIAELLGISRSQVSRDVGGSHSGVVPFAGRPAARSEAMGQPYARASSGGGASTRLPDQTQHAAA